jgi:hypothetical protein
MKMRWLIVFAGSSLLVAGVYLFVQRSSVRHTEPPPQAKLPPSAPSAAFARSSALRAVRTVPKPLLAAIPPRCAIILGQENGVSYNVRYAALKKLYPPLASNEVQALYVQLYRHSNEDPMPEDDLHAFKNEVATALLRQQPQLEQLPWHLMRMYADEQQGEVWRDYCIQHLGTLYNRADSPTRRVIADLFWKATEQKDGTIAGTTLLALEDNVHKADIPRERLAARALVIAQDETFGPEPRATALQVCVLLNERRALIPARHIARTQSPTILRISAIGALGLLGDAEDLAILQPLTRDEDMRLRQAAIAAVKRLTVPDKS